MHPQRLLYGEIEFGPVYPVNPGLDGLSEFIPRDLQKGEWELFCAECGFRAGKMTAVNPRCPDCRTWLHQASEF